MLALHEWIYRALWATKIFLNYVNYSNLCNGTGMPILN